MGLRDIESALPPGFRFHPSDEELVCHYLYNKVADLKSYQGTMVEVDLHTREPWELPEGAKLSENDWYFFSFRDRKYATGSRTNRATKSGYWKATGKDRIVYHPKTRGVVGMRKTLVFYSGRAPNGIKTGWVMHEFRLENPHTPPKEDWVLCRVFHKKKGDTTVCLNAEKEHHELGFSSSSPPLIEHQSVADGCCELMDSSVTTSTFPHVEDAILNLGVLHYNFLDHFRQDHLEATGMMDTVMGMGIKDDVDADVDADDDNDVYGFLLDLGLDDDHGMGGINNNVDDFRF